MPFTLLKKFHHFELTTPRIWVAPTLSLSYLLFCIQIVLTSFTRYFSMMFVYAMSEICTDHKKISLRNVLSFVEDEEICGQYELDRFII